MDKPEKPLPNWHNYRALFSTVEGINRQLAWQYEKASDATKAYRFKYGIIENARKL